MKLLKSYQVISCANGESKTSISDIPFASIIGVNDHIPF
jgi:hypothetical protein